MALNSSPCAWWAPRATTATRCASLAAACTLGPDDAEFFNSVNDVREQMREHIRAELDAGTRAKVPVTAIGGLTRSNGQ